MTIGDGGHGNGLILAGDIGGTKTQLGLFAGSADQLRLLRFRNYPTWEAASAIHLIEAFLAEGSGEPVREACLGVAAPVMAGVARIVNLPWMIEAEPIRTHFGFVHVHLINDLVAMATAIPSLRADQYMPLNEAEPFGRGTIGLVAAGTGLGEALLLWDGKRYLSSPSEGGHKDFAPRTERQFRLLQFLAAQYGPHVSVERVVSGPGLADIYQFLVRDGEIEAPAWLREQLAEEDPAKVIAETAIAGRNAACGEALALFVDAYGAEAGNLALQGFTTGGLYVGGGIAPKILPALLSGSFLEAFTAKGRMALLLASIPVRLITDPQVSLHGAAAYCQLIREKRG